jgi:cytoskeletal protein RodZ
MGNDNNLLGLATIRQNRGISLQSIADRTKISIRSLAAIEEGDFKKLPGGIYNTSYIRQYARAIDYDEAAILAVYHRAMGTEDLSAPAAGSDRGGKGSVGRYRPASLFGL